MSHEFESGFLVREPAWHKLGTIVQEAQDSAGALKLAGLDWVVETRSVYFEGAGLSGTYEEIPRFKAVIRTSDESVLGILSDRYVPVQNHIAFAFTDALLGKGQKYTTRYETAGSLLGGRRIWLLAKLDPPITIAGDTIAPYLCFTNSHDGSTGVRIAITPIRVVCANTLTMALTGAKRVWSTVHMGDMASKLAEAANTLELTEAYLESMPETAEAMIEQSLYPDEVRKFLDQLFPVAEDAGKIAVDNAEYQKSILTTIQNETADLKKFRGSAWSWYNSVADMVQHMEPIRKTARYRETLFANTVDGHPILQKAERILATIKE